MGNRSSYIRGRIVQATQRLKIENCRVSVYKLWPCWTWTVRGEGLCVFFTRDSELEVLLYSRNLRRDAPRARWDIPPAVYVAYIQGESLEPYQKLFPRAWQKTAYSHSVTNE